MRVNGIKAKTKRRYKITIHSRHTKPVLPNPLKGKIVTAPNTAWVSDITYVGWSMVERITDDLTSTAFLKDVMRRNPDNNLIFHSDRGSHYASYRFRNLLASYNIT